jgi:hypothetical protein
MRRNKCLVAAGFKVKIESPARRRKERKDENQHC